MEQLGPLPNVDAVLNKLKSDGTFDQFRKTCLSSIEAEPSFRAYGEHIEVVSRRYLQNYKWRESTTKNQVRGKLKDHAIGVIAGPDIQVGMPLPSLVDKVLESKSKELLPKITEIVDQLRQVRSKPTDNTNSNSTQPPDTQSSTKTQSTLAPEPTKPKLTEFGSLPIDIPGLNTSSTKKEPSATAATATSTTGGSDGKSVKGKSKMNDGASSKELKGSMVKNKPSQGTSGGKAVVTKESGKQKDKDKEKDEKGPNNKGSDDGVSKAAKVSKPKKVKDEVKETLTSVHKEEQQKESKVMSDVNTSDSKLKENENKETNKTEAKEHKLTGGKTETKLSKQGESRGKEKESSKDKEADPNENKDKPVTTRRSARLASLTETKDDIKKEEGMEDGAPAPAPGESLTEAVTLDEETERKDRGKKRSRSVKKTQSVGRKKARMISSSSEESEQVREEVSSEEEEDQQSKDERRVGEPLAAVKGKGKVKEISPDPKLSSKSSRKRLLQHSHEEPASLRRKKPKTKSNGKESKLNSQETTRNKEEMVDQESESKPNKRKSKKPQRLPQRASKSPPVVITRYNRHVKPNRRYLDTSGTETETKSDREEEEGGGDEEPGGDENILASGDRDFEENDGGSDIGDSSSNYEEEGEDETKSPESEKSSKIKLEHQS